MKYDKPGLQAEPPVTPTPPELGSCYNGWEHFFSTFRPQTMDTYNTQNMFICTILQILITNLREKWSKYVTFVFIF